MHKAGRDWLIVSVTTLCLMGSLCLAQCCTAAKELKWLFAGHTDASAMHGIPGNFKLLRVVYILVLFCWDGQSCVSLPRQHIGTFLSLLYMVLQR